MIDGLPNDYDSQLNTFHGSQLMGDDSAGLLANELTRNGLWI